MRLTLRLFAKSNKLFHIKEAVVIARRQLDAKPSLQNTRALAEALLASSRVKHQLDLTNDSLDDSLQVVNLLSNSDATDLRAAALVNAAFRYIELEQPQDAIDTFLSALSIHDSPQSVIPQHSLADFNTRGTILVELARLYASIDQHDRALEFMQRATRIAHAVAPEAPHILFPVLSELAELHLSLGQTDQLPIIGQQIQDFLATSPTPSPLLAPSISDAAAFFLNASSPRIACDLVSYLLGHDLSPEDQARALFIKAASLSDMPLQDPEKHFEPPLPLIRHSLEIYRTLGSPPAQTASVLSELSRVLAEVGQPDEALPPAQEMVELQKIACKEPDPEEHVRLAQLLNELAQRYLTLGNHENALAIVQESKSICKKHLDLPSAHTQFSQAAFINVKVLSSLKKWEDVVHAVDELQAALQSQIEDEADVPDSFLMLFQSTELLITALEAVGTPEDLEGAKQLLRAQKAMLDP